MSLLPTPWIKKMRSQNMGAERLQPQKLNDFLRAVWKSISFWWGGLVGLQGDEPKQCFGEVRGGSRSFALSHGGEGPGQTKKERARSQELLRLVGKLFDD